MQSKYLRYKTMTQFLKKYKIHIIGSILGGVGGYLYWSYIGCSSGSCLITSVWYNNTIYGGVMGYLVASMISDYIQKKKQPNEQLNS